MYSFLALGLFSLWAVPKTDVVLKTTDGVLLHVEFISENEKQAIVDVRSAIFPAAFCDDKSQPAWVPKGKFKNPSKFLSGECRFTANPFIARSMPLEKTLIRTRHETTLLVLNKAGEKKQLPFADVSGGFAWGYQLGETAKPLKDEKPRNGLAPFALDKSNDTVQTVDAAGVRTTLYPRENWFHKWSKFDPRVGLYYSPLAPTADINVLNFGVIGFTLENSIAVPDFKFLEPLKKYSLRLRGGFNFGYHHFSQDLIQNSQAVSTGTITLMPLIFHATIFWDWKPKSGSFTLSPFLRLGDGIVFSSVFTEVKDQYKSLLAPGAESSRSGSYIGNGFMANIGLEFTPRNWPVRFVFDAGYFIHSQDITGQYFTFNLGAAWHYGQTLPEPKTIPITYLGNKSVNLNLKGFTKTPDGKPLAGAKILVRVKGSQTVQKEVTTDAKGAYTIELESGLDYEIDARKDSYAKASVELPLMQNDKKTRDQDFILAPMTYSLEGVNFKPESDELIKGSDKALLELIKFLSANKEIRIEIGGHTAANIDDTPATLALSKKRAEAVRKFIVSKGIDEKRMQAEGYGGSKPIADGKTAAGAAKNRRVEVKVLNE